MRLSETLCLKLSGDVPLAIACANKRSESASSRSALAISLSYCSLSESNIVCDVLEVYGFGCGSDRRQGFFGFVRIVTTLSAVAFRSLVTADGGGFAAESVFAAFGELGLFWFIGCVFFGDAVG